MVNSQPKRPHLPRRNVRLDTLVRLRWLSIIGQTLAVLITYFVLEYDLPIWNCLAVIACAVSLNIVLHARFRLAQRLEPERTAWLLGFDLAELALLIYFTGGLDNPFAFFFLGPVLIAATALPPKMTVILGTFAIVCSTVLIEFHYPLPWSADDNLVLTRGYVIVNWISMVWLAGSALSVLRRSDQVMRMCRSGISTSARIASSGASPGPGETVSVRQSAEPT